MSASSSVAFPFIVGFPRSGTTLLRAMLNAHPELDVPPEGQFVLDLSRIRALHRPGEGFDADLFLDHLFRHLSFPSWGLSRDQIAGSHHGWPPSSYPDAIRAVFAAHAEASGKPRYADKTPHNVLHLRRVAELFPEALFIHLIRDGRDAALSQLERRWATSIDEVAFDWRRHIRAGRAAGLALGSARYVEVTYERLVEDPHRELRRIAALIGVGFDERMLSYYETADSLADWLPVRKVHPRLALPPTPGLRDWRTEMSEADRARFETVAGPLLEELGYELVPSPRTLAARTRLLASVHFERLRHAVRLRSRARRIVRDMGERLRERRKPLGG